MNEKERYDPEDLEQLMRERRFEELLDEEKAYVLRHMSGPDEYEQVRKTLLAVAAHMDNDPEIEPDPKIKEALMSQFVKEEKAGFTFYLNSIKAFLLPTGRNFYAQPAYQFAMAAVVVLIGFFLLYQPINTDNVAVHEESKEFKAEDKMAPQKQPAPNEDGNETQTPSEELTAENEVSIEADADMPEPVQLESDEEIVLADEAFTHDLAEPEDAPVERQLDAIEEEESLDMIAKESETRKTEEIAFRYEQAEDAKNDNEIVLNNGTSAGATAPTTIQMDSTVDGYLSYSDDVRVGNSVEPQVTNQVVFGTEDLGSVEIAAEKGSSSKKLKDRESLPALKSANMRQYSELIGLLHTAL